MCPIDATTMLVRADNLLLAPKMPLKGAHHRHAAMLQHMATLGAELVLCTGISIIQEKKLVMCASVGLPDGASIERHKAACSWTLLPKTPEVMVVEDMLEDSRWVQLMIQYVPALQRLPEPCAAPISRASGRLHSWPTFNHAVALRSNCAALNEVIWLEMPGRM